MTLQELCALYEIILQKQTILIGILDKALEKSVP